MSKEKEINEINFKISRIAEPGDLIFFITQNTSEPQESETGAKPWRHSVRLRFWPWWKQWLGFDRYDFDAWHVGIYFMGRKRKRHRRINLWIIHSTNKKGVVAEPVSLCNINKIVNGAKRHIEILQIDGITEEQRKTVVDFAYSKIGSKFDQSKWNHTILPYALGLPNIKYNPKEFSCQQLVIAAYAAAGIYFTHPVKSLPIFNIGKYLGRPLGHPRDRVNPRYPYLMDHHLYRDPRFSVKAIIYPEPQTAEIRAELTNLQKYLWKDDSNAPGLGLGLDQGNML